MINRGELLGYKWVFLFSHFPVFSIQAFNNNFQKYFLILFKESKVKTMLHSFSWFINAKPCIFEILTDYMSETPNFLLLLEHFQRTKAAVKHRNLFIFPSFTPSEPIVLYLFVFSQQLNELL